VGGDNRRLNALENSKCRVLSFNYDRLFEKAFAEYFRMEPGRYVNCYQPELLNSGWRGWGGPGVQEEEIAQNRFCFLKLHGSALAWVDQFPGEARYIPCAIGQVVNDEFLWTSRHQRSPFPPQPFIVFPHEKEGVIQSGHTPVYAPYLNKIWTKAAQLIQSAREIRVIGYSFDRNDRPFLIDRLRQSPPECKIVVQGKDPAPIVADLKASYPEIEERFGEPVTRMF
jgi:hypothetical protein